MTVVVVKTFLVLTIIVQVSSESEVEKCTRYIKHLYNNENDRLEMFKKGFLSFNQAEINLINSNLASTTDPEGSSVTVEAMNKYTEGYFNEFLNCVIILEKESLLDPANFCHDKFEDSIRATQHCITEIIRRKFRLTGREFGSEIFDILYKYWALNDIHWILYFNEEHARMNRQLCMGAQYTTKVAEDIYSRFELLLDLYHISITSYYEHFKNKLDDVSDVSQMPTPEEYCERIVGGSSSS